ncbi:hypothetical protein [Candidatus Venteria ishoeyi]|uniref:Uncharacterized protein n=1 Tax=Candidatus Venteria ishoeyi TaxID=1899563 RepID=A0A1H6FD70_9GAMM|nr:hypothetical protein [Candidatus Venteria ishoeyi]SEH08022.1 Uncharacterised protein [Candidatus Venteria ishoeyi]
MKKITLNKYEKIAIKYLIEDLQAATLPGTTLSNVLNTLELRDKAVSNITLEFLKRRKLLALYVYAKKECSLAEYLSSAELEQKNRRLIIEKEALKEKLRQTKLKEEAAIRQQAAIEKQRAYDNNPKNIARAKQLKLRNKYNLSYFIESHYFQNLMKILHNLDKGCRLSESEIIWLNIDGKEYFTDELRARFHNNEADFYATEFRNKKDPWLAVNASSHYRKCAKSKVADLILNTIKVSNLKNIKLKSAIYTTHGGVKRDLHKAKEAIFLGEKAHKLTMQDFRPCTLLGAVHMETGNYNIGQEWYTKAIENGFSEKSMDYELKNIFMRAKQSNKESLRNYLLKIDSERYSWVRKKTWD